MTSTTTPCISLDDIRSLMDGWKENAKAFDKTTRQTYKNLRKIVDPFPDLSKSEKDEIYDIIGI